MPFTMPKKNIYLIGGAVIILIVVIGVAAYLQVTQQAVKNQKNAIKNVATLTKNATVSATPLPAQKLTQTYAEPGMGYAVMFPDSWIIGKTDKGTKSVILTGKQATSAVGATIVIQNLLTKKTDGVYEDATAASNDLKLQLQEQGKDTVISEEAPIDYTTSKGQSVKGVQWYAQFSVNGTKFNQLQIVLTHPNQAYLHSIAYAAPSNVYTANEATARDIIKSFVMSEEPYSATSTMPAATSTRK
jgi:hypothetical protein